MSDGRGDVDAVAWLILRGGLDAREFAALPHGTERTFFLAAMKRAEEMRRAEARELAGYLAECLGAKKTGGGSG